MDTIDVLLSTYNGQKYLKEQIDSIINQNNVNVKIFIRDDGSKDNTLSIINELMKKYDGKIYKISDEYGNIGIIRSYEILTKHSTSKYIAFADQDDIWLPNKLFQSLLALKSIEGDGDIPALVYSDLIIVDEKLKIISNSFYRYLRINEDRGKDFKSLILQNGVVGCTTLFNSSLIKIALPFPEQCIMHDWWLALCANYYGNVEYLPKKLILYRQHQNNAVGAKNIINRIKNININKNNTFKSIKQALALINRRLGKKENYILLKEIDDKNKIKIKIKMLNKNIIKSSFLRNIKFYFFEW